jgi:hypothetical protein
MSMLVSVYNSISVLMSMYECVGEHVRSGLSRVFVPRWVLGRVQQGKGLEQPSRTINQPKKKKKKGSG